MKTRANHPESKMMTHGHDPSTARGAIKVPLYQTSTFAFRSAQEGKSYFELAYGLREAEEGEQIGMIYSRLDNPVLTTLEERLCVWDKAEAAVAFASGMAAISTVMLEFLKPGDVVACSIPVYGGTDHFLNEYLTAHGIQIVEFDHKDSFHDIKERILRTGKANRLRLIFIETPANPTNALVDIQMCSNLATYFSEDEDRVLTVVDNTYMGPVWQHPLEHGADLVVYSATKYIGGHSDVIAGAITGRKEFVGRLKVLRTLLGNMISPHTAWLLLRSLETLKMRMDTHARNARIVAEFLVNHPRVARTYFPGFLKPASPEGKLFQRQCETAGGMISFEVHGGETQAFNFLNNLDLIKIAVSLGSTESLAQHPRSMTHAGLAEEHLDQMGVTPGLIRLSVGVENPEDLIADISQALDAVEPKRKMHRPDNLLESRPISTATS